MADHLVKLELNAIELYAIHLGLELVRKQNHTFLTDDELNMISEDIRRASNSNLDPTILSGRMSWGKEIVKKTVQTEGSA